MININDLNHQQKEAIDKIDGWFKYSPKSTFYLAGYAGTGKTTVMKYVIDRLGLNQKDIKIACYTGKASLVLDKKLPKRYKVSTIHKMIYRPVIISDDFGNTTGVEFKLQYRHKLNGVKLIIIDESSMIDHVTYYDLLSYGIKILFVGDTGQLPPVTRNHKSIDVFAKPDYLLTEIMRQDGDNNYIIELSKMIREGKPVKYGFYGENNEVQIIPRDVFMANKTFIPYFLGADQIICGTNRTRKDINNVVRQLKGFTTTLPSVGDKLICTKNNWSAPIGDSPLVNGLIGEVRSMSESMWGDTFLMDLETPEGDRGYDFEVPKSLFDPTLGETSFENEYTYFDFGYAVTCHKGQGSEWDRVLVFSEVLDPDMHSRWLYTAVTRAVKQLVLVI